MGTRRLEQICGKRKNFVGTNPNYCATPLKTQTTHQDVAMHSLRTTALHYCTGLTTITNNNISHQESNSSKKSEEFF